MLQAIERYRIPLAWGLLILTLIVVGAALFVPLVRAHQDLDASISRNYETLARLKVIAASAEETRARAERMTQQDVARFVFTDASDGDVKLCMMSTMNQVLTIGFRGRQKPPVLGGGFFEASEIDWLTDHITRFSLGGIRAVRDSSPPSKRKAT